MPSVTLTLQAKMGGGAQSYWLAVHDQDVDMSGGSGFVDLDSPGTYVLVWHFIGASGGTLTISGSVGQKSVVQVKQSTIPDGEISGAGQQRFSV